MVPFLPLMFNVVTFLITNLLGTILPARGRHEALHPPCSRTLHCWWTKRFGGGGSVKNNKIVFCQLWEDPQRSFFSYSLGPRLNVITSLQSLAREDKQRVVSSSQMTWLIHWTKKVNQIEKFRKPSYLFVLWYRFNHILSWIFPVRNGSYILLTGRSRTWAAWTLGCQV